MSPAANSIAIGILQPIGKEVKCRKRCELRVCVRSKVGKVGWINYGNGLDLPVGKALRCSAGSTDGNVDGETLDKSDVKAVATRLEWTDPAWDGAKLAGSVGKTLGCEVGSTDGSADGETLSKPNGVALGMSLGWIDGSVGEVLAYNDGSTDGAKLVKSCGAALGMALDSIHESCDGPTLGGSVGRILASTVVRPMGALTATDLACETAQQ